MAPRKKSGRTAAETAYADLMKEAQTLVGDVGESYEAYTAKLADAAAARERYETARVTAVNDPSLRLHERHGFVRVGLEREVAWKLGRWLDVVVLQRLLSRGAP